jgi:hypothetical protein
VSVGWSHPVREFTRSRNRRDRLTGKLVAVPSPFGRYLARLSSRCAVAAVTIYELQGAARTWAGVGSAVPGWAIGVMIAAYALALALAASLWFVPATVIDQGGIHRTLGRPRDVGWSDAVDFPIVRSWCWLWRVTVQLPDGRVVRLNGVPANAVPRLRHFVGLAPETRQDQDWRV